MEYEEVKFAMYRVNMAYDWIRYELILRLQ